MPTIVNRHHFKSTSEIPKPWMYIGRRTVLGNPYTLAQHGDDALPLYRRWLWRHIQDPNSMEACALRSIRPEHTLVCSCKPRPCHGDVVIAAWEWQRKQENR